MGMWSVYCGASNITINSDQECCIIPLKEEYPKALNWIPQSLPIFGKYNDCGGMYDIVEDDNTRLIENHLGVTIQEFVDFLISDKIDRDEEIADKLSDIEDWSFMWLNREVYEFMSKNHSDEHSFANKLNDWRNLSLNEKLDWLGWSFRVKYESWADTEFMERVRIESKNLYDSIMSRKPNTIAVKYIDNLDVFGDRLAGIHFLRNNMGSMSNPMKPFCEHITPQCGEYKQHQILLEKFAEINKKYIS
jgi:hypothetical protein